MALGEDLPQVEMGALILGVLRQHGPRLFQTLIDVTEVGEYDTVRQADLVVVRPLQPLRVSWKMWASCTV